MEFLGPVAYALRRGKNMVGNLSIRGKNRGRSAIQAQHQTYSGLRPGQREPCPTTKVPPSSLPINGSKRAFTTVLEEDPT